MRACPICKSRKWYSDGLGGLVCQFGHQREGFQEQESEIETASVTSKKRRSRSKKASNEYYAFQNRTEYAQVLLTVAQWVLRRQLHVLINEMGFVPQIEQVVQHLWILYVNKLCELDLDVTRINHVAPEGSSSALQEYDNDDNLEFLIDIPQDSDSDSDGKGGSQQRSSGNEFSDFNSQAKSMKYSALPCRLSNMSLSFVLVIIYLGCVWLRIPIIKGDIVRWASTGRLSDLVIRQELPNDMKLHLGPHFVKKFFEKERHQSWHFLTSLEFDFIAFYKNFYGITFPEINAPPILYRFIRDFMLPVETYVISKELAQLINLNLEINRNPSLSLLAVIIVIIKMVYGLDGQKRVPNDKDEFFRYFPKFEDWIKKLSERQEKLFSKEIPLDLSDLKEWIDSNPDKYIKHCSDTLVGKNRWPQTPKDTQNTAYINRAKRIEVREVYLMQKEKERDKKIIKNLENNINDFIEPIEKEIQELNFCVEVPGKHSSTSKSCSFSKDPMKHLRNRYSTFLYRNPENDNDKPNLTFGEKYAAYQMFQNRTESAFFKHVELTGSFHEDYERILVFASKMVNATMHDVQQAVMKVEVDLYRIIENKNL
ncbi:19684_t:CDS:10 [Dentiscutata erythropus]|uniref:19684_t:CDS:1 n=1 Tax=Dentiscutata erythropus TaxID=1348616 RepID=A0A9N9IEU1_9GLOM|nr:19684_t:CDS:10 [Dentiscutata erythropus]